MGIFKVIKQLFSKPPPAEEQTQTNFLRDVNITPLEQAIEPAMFKRILLYEDSITWSSVLKAALENENYDVFLYDNPSAVLDNIRKHKPDIILMDVNMPKMSGLEATKIVKSRFQYKNLPVIILTSANSPKDKMEAMKVGARTFLTKDQPLEELVIAIKAYMENTALKNDITQVIKSRRRKFD